MTEIEAKMLLVDELEKLADGGRFWVPGEQVGLFDQVCKAAGAAIIRAYERGGEDRSAAALTAMCK